MFKNTIRNCLLESQVKYEQVYLDKSILAHLSACEGGCRAKKSRIGDFFHRLTNAEHESSVHEGNHDVGIELLYLSETYDLCRITNRWSYIFNC